MMSRADRRLRRARARPRPPGRRRVRPRQALHRRPRPPEMGRRHEGPAGATGPTHRARRSLRLSRASAEAGRMRGARHHLHGGHRAHARVRHRGRRRRLPLLAARAEARDHGDGRRHVPLRRARRLGQRDVPPAPRRRVRRRGGAPLGLVQEIVPAGTAARPRARARRARSPRWRRSRSRRRRSRPASTPSRASRPRSRRSAVQQRLANSEDAAEGVALVRRAPRAKVHRALAQRPPPIAGARPRGCGAGVGVLASGRLVLALGVSSFAL